MNTLNMLQRTDLINWLKNEENKVKLLECDTDAQALSLASADLPWLTQDYLYSFQNARKTTGVHTGRTYRSALRKDARVKQAAAKKAAQESQKTLEERVVIMQDDLSRLLSSLENFCLAIETLQADVRIHDRKLEGLKSEIKEIQDKDIPRVVVERLMGVTYPTDLPDHLRGPQCSSVKPNPPAPRMLKESQDMCSIRESN